MASRLVMLGSPAIAFLIFVACYIVLAFYLSIYGARDPDSVFFDPARAYDAMYSAERREQARALTSGITAASRSQSDQANEGHHLCVGITSVQRAGASYLEDSVGSILAGLTEDEREQIYLTTFIVNPNPTEHENYNSTWLNALSNRVLTYHDLPADVLQTVQDLEQSPQHFQKKPLLDYELLLTECYHTGAPYILMLEDDVIAADGWFYRMKNALRRLEEKQEYRSTLYLRLFYNEGIQGFNGEAWPMYLFWSAATDLVVLGSLLSARHFFPSTRRALTGYTMIVICFVCMPMLIGLYFAAGGLVVQPLPHGLRRMDTYGCCSQAFVFPRWQVPELLEYYRETGIGFVDVLTEKYANKYGLARWALVPAAFQHVGRLTSKDPGNVFRKYGRPSMELIFNFSFEKLKAKDQIKFHG